MRSSFTSLYEGGLGGKKANFAAMDEVIPPISLFFLADTAVSVADQLLIDEEGEAMRLNPENIGERGNRRLFYYCRELQ